MEKIASDFRLSELKQGNLNKDFDELHSRASSEWKELENHLDSTRSSLQTVFEQLVERENDILYREKQLEDREVKVKQLDGIEKLCKELSEELELKKKQHNAVLIKIEEKERELSHVEKSVSESKNKLDSLERSIRQKSEENQGMFKKFDEVAELKEDLLNAMQRALEKCMKEYELKKEQLNVCQSSIDECGKEIKMKEEKLNSIQNSIVECSYELKLKEDQLDLVRKLKEKILGSLEKLMHRYAHELDAKARKFENFVKVFEVKEESLESKFEELYLIDNKVNGCLREFELKDKNFASLQRLVEERSRELEIKESEFEARVKEFKLREEEFESIRKSAEMGVKEKTKIPPSVVIIGQSEQNHSSSSCHQSCLTKEKKDLFWLLNQHLKRQELLCSQIFTVLKASSDPVKLALDAVRGIYQLRLSREHTEFDASIARAGCNLLLELLMKVSPEINPQARDEAMKLASDWKAKMKVASYNGLEVLDFLQFLVSFRLVSAFDVNELRSLFDAFCPNRQASQLQFPSDIAREEYIRTLIQKGEIIHAVTLISELKLTAKFPSVPLLIKYLEDAKNSTQRACRKRIFDKAKKKAMEKEVAALKAVMECIKFCNLESDFPSGTILKRLSVLENECKLFGHEVEKQKKRRRTDSFTPKDQTQLTKTKSPAMTILDNAVGANISSDSALPQCPSPEVRTEPSEGFVKLVNAVGANTSSGSALPQSLSPEVRTEPTESFIKLVNAVGANLSSGSALPEVRTELTDGFVKLVNAVGANTSSGSALPQSPSPEIRTEPSEGFVKLVNAVGANTSSGSALPESTSPNVRTEPRVAFVKLNIGSSPKDQTKQSKTKCPQTTNLENAVGNSTSSSSAPPKTPSPNAWTKPPVGFVKLNFGFVGRSDCGYLSIVARDNNGAMLAIWCRKIPHSDPLMGEALAALGALTLASSKGWDTIFLEGDSLQLISYLQRGSEPMLSVSGIVSDSVALMQSFRRAIPVWIPPEANTLARNVSQWAAGNNVEDGQSWISLPRNLSAELGMASEELQMKKSRVEDQGLQSLLYIL
ncbi:Frigida-like [Trema orientale]|uniref:Frigida-like n=1 Tax=Trema orientale TaxID=63057 RepID=A0A2P5CQ13_TREOI|nr:Frigida-like [Trema orientale]